MKFALESLSSKLEKLGCKSESNWYYKRLDYAPNIYNSKLYYTDNKERSELDDIISQAFEYSDFIGPSEQAKKNAELVFGRKLIDVAIYQDHLNKFEPSMIIKSMAYKAYRKELMDLTESEFWPFIEKALK